MNKEELVSALAKKTGRTKRESEFFIDAVFQVISDVISSGDKVQIVGFGTFETKDRAPRTGRNMNANVPVHIPARRVPYFTPGKVLKDQVERSSNTKD